MLRVALLVACLHYYCFGQAPTARVTIREQIEKALLARVPDQNQNLEAQARELWFHAKMARLGHRPDQMLADADRGFRALYDSLWDRQQGGFFNDSSKSRKQLRSQALALHALSEFYLASGRGDVLSLASRLFDLLERKSHDGKHGGYLEATDSTKLMSTHLRLLEAMTSHLRATKAPLVYGRVRELIDILSNAVLRKHSGACTEHYNADWSPQSTAPQRVVHSQHFENIVLLADATEATGIPPYPYLDLFRELWAYSLKHGSDAQGAFFESGPLDKATDSKVRPTSLQAQAAVTALQLWKLTGDTKYWMHFEKWWQQHPTIDPAGTRAWIDAAGLLR